MLLVSFFSMVSSTHKTERQDITEILLKVVLNIATHPPTQSKKAGFFWGQFFEINKGLSGVEYHLYLPLTLCSPLSLDQCFHCNKNLDIKFRANDAFLK